VVETNNLCFFINYGGALMRNSVDVYSLNGFKFVQRVSIELSVVHHMQQLDQQHLILHSS